MEYKIKQEQLKAIFDYLIERPYKESAYLVNIVQNLELIVPEKKEESKKDKK